MTFSVLCRASRPDPLQQFRRKRGDVQGTHRISEKHPVNTERLKITSEEETRKFFRGPGKRKDPWDRLEFFKREDIETGIFAKKVETAKPIDRPNVVPAKDAHEYYIKKLDVMRKSQLTQMIRSGKITKEEVEEQERKCWELLEDPYVVSAAESWLCPPDGATLVEFPDERDQKHVRHQSMSFIEQLHHDYNVPGYIHFKETELKQGFKTPVVGLKHPCGEEVVISLHGGCILAWMSPQKKNRLFIHPEEKFDNATSIMNSGISLAFPFFNAGITPDEGFLNKMLWDVVRSEVGVDWIPDPAPSITLRCQDTPETREIWPHQFEIFYKITLSDTDDFPRVGPTSKEKKEFHELVKKHKTIKAALEADKQIKEEKAKQEEIQRKRTMGKGRAVEEAVDVEKKKILPSQLRLQFTVRNTGDKPMEFMFACKNHLRIRSVAQFGNYIRLLGLGARLYLDYTIIPGKPVLRLWDDDYLTLGNREGGWNAIFTENKLNDVFFCPGYPEYFDLIYRRGFPDVLLHHEGIKEPRKFEIGNAMAMLGRGRVTVPAKLGPGEEWEGEYVLRHHQEYWEEPIFGYQEGLPPAEEAKIALIPTLYEDQEINTIE